MMDTDRLLVERLQAREMEELSEVQKASLLVELIEKRKKHFADLRAQEKRNNPPTKTQMKSQMSTYLKHMGGYKQSHLKGRSFDEIKELFDSEMRKVNEFVAMDSEAQKSNENVKPVIDDSKEIRKCIEIFLDDGDEVLIEATPISSRSPTIIDYKIHKEGKKTYFKIIRADAIMDEFSLNKNKWLSDRSESENQFFGQHTSTRLSLVEFVSNYDTKMDTQDLFMLHNHDFKYTTLDLKNGRWVEKEATELYTKTLIYDVQEEIYSSLMHFYCLNVHEGESHRHFAIRDTGADFKRKGTVVEVNYIPSEGKSNCSCLRYECYELLCRHIFYVLRLSKVHNIPKSYLQKRWSKNAMPHKSVGRTVEVRSSSNSVNDSDSLIRDIYSKVKKS
nr:hypothetical protein [Tanacetum cinerariifolium]